MFTVFLVSRIEVGGIGQELKPTALKEGSSIQAVYLFLFMKCVPFVFIYFMKGVFKLIFERPA